MDNDGSREEFIGESLTELATLIGCHKQTSVSALSSQKSDNRGTLIIQTDTVQTDNSVWSFNVRAANLQTKKVMGCLGHDRPFLQIWRAFSAADGDNFVKVKTLEP